MRPFHFFLPLLSLSLNLLHAQSGALDPTFGSGGKTIISTSIGYDAGYGLAIQPDGKIVVSGESQNGTVEGDYDVLLTRFNSDGTLDAGFGNGGIIVKPIGGGWDLSGSVLIQPDGKIVVAGGAWNGTKYQFIALRYHTNGTLDNSFGNGGLAKFGVGGVQDNAWGSVLQPDGKIILTGPTHNGSNYDFGMARLNANGTLDAGFGNGGKVITTLSGGDDYSWSVALQQDGRILLGGRSPVSGVSNFALARYTATGTLDNTFGNGGIVRKSFGGASSSGRLVVLQPDGKILLGGTTSFAGTDDFGVMRFHPDGSLDETFGVGGMVVIPVGTGEDVLWGLLLEPNNGKIILAGYGVSPATGYDFALVRLRSNGFPDSTFGVNGIALLPIGSGNDFGNNVALQSDGKIVMSGAAVSSQYDLALARVQNTITGVEDPMEEAAVGLTCFPDPFDVSTQIRFDLRKGGQVRLTVHDLQGRVVEDLVDERLGAGSYEVTFEARGLIAGVYVVRLQAEGGEFSRQVLLIR